MQTKIALAGNPNCGKTTLFNELAGTAQYVGNWPGVTVEKKEGTYTRNKDVSLIDLPGVYSLMPYSPEEIVTRDFLTSGEADVVINVVDATNLERNLYLTTQILDLEIPTVVALNMMDALEKRGDEIDIASLSEQLGCPVVEISALRNRGIDNLMNVALDLASNPPVGHKSPHADKTAEDAKLQSEISAALKSTCIGDCSSCLSPSGEDALSEEARARYERIASICENCVTRAPRALTTTQKIDRVVTNRFLGIPIFIVVMFVVYWLAVSLGGGVVTDWANDGISGDGWLYTGMDSYEAAVEEWENSPDPSPLTEPDPASGEYGLWIPGLSPLLSSALEQAGAAPWVISLVIDGVLAGVGAVVGFVPQLVILFLLLGILEGCGYMARVAFIMDRVFRRFGLSGKSFIPMLIASGCGVPAVMSTKTIENERDRRLTIMTTTMIPCGAKLPIIALVFGALAGSDYESTWWVAPLFYFLGLAAIIISCLILRKFKEFAGKAAPFIMELPQYHVPTVKSVLLSTWERIKDYLAKAGTIIFLSTIVIWFLMNFGMYEGEFGLLDSEQAGYLNFSIMAGIGNALSWFFVPLGFGDWQATVTTVTGLVAKENVVATVGILTNLGEVGELDPTLWEGFGAMLGGSSAAITAFCAFNLLCAPCFAAIGAIRTQMQSSKWTWATIGYMCAFAWSFSFMIYQFGGVLSGEFGFSFWTICAGVVLAGFLFLLLRPMPKYKEGNETC